ncbi:MAG: hypothetical protein QOE92_1236 [Chloroflexota bacterium]|jgi:nitrite reductase/ring-hydroxylating ferredoxin subunit|nr:hypothetical protein [Chloroflexota bacterium]
MSSAADRVAAFVDAILRDRRPRRFPAEPEEGEALQAAAALRSARPAADLPSPEFVAGLERRLAAEAGGAAPLSRRGLLQAAGVTAAAAAVAGVAIRLVDPNAHHEQSADRDTLTVRDPAWVAVAALSAVPAGQAVRFTAGAVEGFVINHGDRVEAMSAVCTHMGCILKFNAAKGQIDCPCHGASFRLDGTPFNREYLAALPLVRSRVRDGMVEVEVSPA